MEWVVPDLRRPRSARWGGWQLVRSFLFLAVLANGFLAVVETCVADCVTPPANLIGWWAGDGNASDQTGTNNGTLAGGATATATGMVGQCFSFDGTNAYVSIPDSAALRPTNFTVEAWVLFSSLNSAGLGGSPAGDQYIVFKQNPQSGNFEGIDVGKTRISGGDVFQFITTSASGSSVQILSATTIATNTWYHIAAVRGPSSLQLYVNGQLERQTNISFAQNYGTLPLYFGTTGQASWDHKFAGNLDEVTLYNRALTSNEIAAIYAAGSSGKCKPASGPSIASQPQGESVVVGGSAGFGVTASGTAPFGYQWNFNGAALDGATNAALSITNVQMSQGGNYMVVVTNSISAATSAVAVLTVASNGSAPFITAQPNGQTVVAGGNAAFSVGATGTAPLKYQWTLNGTNLSGATNTNYTVSGAQSRNAGTYTVTVTNIFGSTNSAAVLTVLPAGTVTINGAQTFQVIDGFGVNANHRSWNNDELKPVIDALINQGGMTLFHVVFDNNNWEGTNDNSDANAMNWTYYNTIYSSAEFQKMWGLMAYLNQSGITTGLVPDFEGPAPAWMGGLTLASGMENEYAETIASCLIYARKTMGLQFSTVGPVNEPDTTYSGINLSGSGQLVTVMTNLIQQLNTNGMSDVMVSGPDLASTSTAWLQAMTNNPTLMGRLAHFGLHSYQNETADASGVYNFIQQSAYPSVNFWMTEYNVWCAGCQSGSGGNNTWSYGKGTAAYMMQLLSQGASAGIVWEGYDSEYVDFNPQTGGNNPPHWSYWGLFGVDNINATPKTYTPRAGFYTLAQIAAFVRPGAQRIGVSSPPSGLTLLAFYNTNNEQFTITGVNSNSTVSAFSGLLTSLPVVSNLDFYYTTSATNLFHSGQVPVSNNVFSVSVPADSVFTLTYTAPLPTTTQPSPPTPPIFLTPSIQDSGILFSVSATSGYNCQIQTSTDLTNWQVVTNIASESGTVQFTDTNAVDFLQRFYRAVLTY